MRVCVFVSLFASVCGLQCVYYQETLHSTGLQVEGAAPNTTTNRTCDQYDLEEHYCFKELYQEGPKSYIINKGCSCEGCVGQTGMGIQGRDKCKPFGEGCTTWDMKYSPHHDESTKGDLRDYFHIDRTYTLCCCKTDGCNAGHKLTILAPLLLATAIIIQL